MPHYLVVEVSGFTGPDRPGFAAARRLACLGRTGKRLLTQSYALVILLGTILCCTWHSTVDRSAPVMDPREAYLAST